MLTGPKSAFRHGLPSVMYGSPFPPLNNKKRFYLTILTSFSELHDINSQLQVMKSELRDINSQFQKITFKKLLFCR